MTKDILLIEKKFLSKEECYKLIQFYNQNIHESFRYRDTFPINTEKFHNITEKIEKICYDLSPGCQLDTHQIVKWPKGSKMEPHFDPKDDVFACLVYLNDDYMGGETCFERKKFFSMENIKPEIGKLVIFSNSKILHWVNEVKNGTRYTLALWFVRK
jgi:hypothetical protein